jgi:hypothetical protein
VSISNNNVLLIAVGNSGALIGGVPAISSGEPLHVRNVPQQFFFKKKSKKQKTYCQAPVESRMVFHQTNVSILWNDAIVLFV